MRTTATRTEPIRVALAGAGGVSWHHARALRDEPRARIVAVVDPCIDRARKLAAAFGIPACFGTLNEAIAVHPRVVHVLTPPECHCEVTLQALQMGCDVFVEKPMAETTADCDRMIAASTAAKRVLSVNHSAKMDPIIQKARRLIQEGACGEVLGVDWFRSSDYPPYAGGPLPAAYRDGAYPWQDLGVHGLSLFETFLGRILELDVQPRFTGRNTNLYYDEWRALAECERGTGHMYLSWSARPIFNEVTVHGTKGILRADCFLQICQVRKTLPAPKFVQLAVGVAADAASVLVKLPLNTGRFLTGRLLPAPGIHASVQGFYDALARGASPPISADEGRRLVHLMETHALKANAEKTRRFHPVSKPQARVLVTGASGLLGGALMERLAGEGQLTRALARRPSDAIESNLLIEPAYGDLGDPEAVERAVRGADLVFHVGAAMRGGAAEHQAGTVLGTRNIVASCLRNKVRRLVYVSSLTVLDHAGHRPGEPVTEASPLEPHAEKRGLYTQSKLEAELIVRRAAAEQGLPAVILRPGQIFGRGSEKIPPSGVIGLGGLWIVVGSGDAPLPLVYVDDVVDALLLAARAGCNGSVYHIVDSSNVTQNEYLARCGALARRRVARVPGIALFGAAALAETLSRLTGVGVPLTIYRLRSARPLGPCDCSAARRELRWTPRIGVSEGLARVFGPNEPPYGRATDLQLTTPEGALTGADRP